VALAEVLHFLLVRRLHLLESPLPYAQQLSIAFVTAATVSKPGDDVMWV
jgi:hypothetical protein